MLADMLHLDVGYVDTWIRGVRTYPTEVALSRIDTSARPGAGVVSLKNGGGSLKLYPDVSWEEEQDKAEGEAEEEAEEPPPPSSSKAKRGKSRKAPVS